MSKERFKKGFFLLIFKVIGYNYSKVTPEPRENPRIVSLSRSALELLDLDKDAIEKDPESAEYLCGNKILPGSIVK